MTTPEQWGRIERCLKVFISSPTDVDAERQAVKKVVDDLNNTLGSRLGLSMRTVDWNSARPRGVSTDKFIREQLKDCDLFVMIFWRRYGSPPTSDGKYLSGTEMEYEIARRLRERSGGKARPEILVYFKEIADKAQLEDPGKELGKVLEFQERIKFSHFYKTYAGTDVFPHILKDHLIEWLLEISDSLVPKDKKGEMLRRFFSLGAESHSSKPSTLIVYPRSEKKIEDMTHLLPYMVIEDFQAIHKITKCLNIAGYDDIKAITTDLYSRDREKKKNKIFLCLPRNPHAGEHLKDQPEARFRIVATNVNGRQVRKILWKGSKGEAIEVSSPQADYLRMQRGARNSNWPDNPGLCYAVDFGVVARFESPDARARPNLAGIKDFFLFGIRGLGTWGAAWYLDRCIENLDRDSLCRNSFQHLLKITHYNNRIREVVDVSDESQAYFNRENDPAVIRKRILKKACM